MDSTTKFKKKKKKKNKQELQKVQPTNYFQCPIDAIEMSSCYSLPNIETPPPVTTTQRIFPNPYIVTPTESSSTIQPLEESNLVSTVPNNLTSKDTEQKYHAPYNKKLYSLDQIVHYNRNTQERDDDFALDLQKQMIPCLSKETDLLQGPPPHQRKLFHQPHFSQSYNEQIRFGVERSKPKRFSSQKTQGLSKKTEEGMSSLFKNISEIFDLKRVIRPKKGYNKNKYPYLLSQYEAAYNPKKNGIFDESYRSRHKDISDKLWSEFMGGMRSSNNIQSNLKPFINHKYYKIIK